MKFIVTAALVALVGGTLLACNADAADPEEPVTYEVTKTDAEWRAELSPSEFHIIREKGTERAFTGEYWDNKAAGVYTCRACGHPLYDSKDKFKSGTGWPSYTQPVSPDSLALQSDTAWGMKRTELMCARCGGHLGHVFDDGPKPTGERHCINSASLRFVPRATNSTPAKPPR